MRTSKSFSTISYNTQYFLLTKLNELVNCNKLAFYCFIVHKPEEDEKKEHIHLFIIPNGSFDTSYLQDCLTEFDPVHPTTPFRILPCCSSKFNEWYYYSTHNKKYLASKCQQRKYEYSFDNIQSSNIDYLRELVSTITIPKSMKDSQILSYLNDGKTPEDLVSSGIMSISQYGYWSKFFETAITFRNGRKSHTSKYDSETGEIIQEEKKPKDLPF